MSVTINEAQGLYVIPCGEGFSCLGFDVCAERSERLASWIFQQMDLAQAFNIPPAEKRGTMAAYARYVALCGTAEQLCKMRSIRCDTELSPQLIGLEGKRVEAIDAPGEQPRRFYVGKSTGWQPIHLEISKSNSTGGPGAVRSYHSVRVIPGTRR